MNATHNAYPPTILLETGSMLSLLLGGSWRHDGIGYLWLLKHLAQRGVIKLAVPDVDVMEFLDVPAPVYAEDLTGDSPRLTTRNIPSGYALREERIAFLRSLIEGPEPALQIVPTHTGQQYLERLRTKLLPHNPELKTQRDKDWPPPTNEALRQRLLSGFSYLSKAVKSNNLRDKHGHTRSSGLQDRGEVGIADAIRTLKQAHSDGMQHPIFVLYEGNDVRARILWRLKETEQDQIGDPVPETYHPGQGFDAKPFELFGPINFLSTKGFLIGLARAALIKDKDTRVANQRTTYVLTKREALSQQNFETAYDHEIVAAVNARGLSRQYKKLRDRPLHALAAEDEAEPVNGDNQTQSPWMYWITQLASGSCGPAPKAVIMDVLKQWMDYRQEETLKTVNLHMEKAIQQMDTFEPKFAAKVAAQKAEWMRDIANEYRNDLR